MNKFERHHPIENEPIERKDIIEDTNPYHIPDHLMYKKKVIVTDVNYILPSIPMKIEAPILEKQIKEKGMHPIEKSKSKTPKRKLKKINSKTDKSTMASIQKKLS